MTIRETLKDAFAYPFRDNGRMILIWGTILGVASHFASLIPVIGLIAFLALSAYFCAIFFDIILTSATGTDDCPGFPDLADILEDLIFPYLKVIGAVFISFFPFIIANFVAPMPVIMVMLGLGIIYFPMAILAVAILNRFTAMGPQIVFPAIMNAGGRYWFTVAFLFLFLLAQSFVSSIFGDIPILGILLVAFLGMVALMVNGRTIGLLYREKEEELHWL